MRFQFLALCLLMLTAAAPAYERWGEFDFGGRKLIYVEADSDRPGLVALALCSSSSSLVSWRLYGDGHAKGLIARLIKEGGAATAISDCDRACQLAAQAIARRNGLPDRELDPRQGLSWALGKTNAVALLRDWMGELAKPRSIDQETARRERQRAADMLSRFERQCGSRF